MCAKFCVDSPFSLAVGGRKNGFHVINVQKLLPGMLKVLQQTTWLQWDTLNPPDKISDNPCRNPIFY